MRENTNGQSKGTLRQQIAGEINECGLEVFGDFWGGRQGGYQIQQNPDEFARLCLLLAAFEPFENSLEIGVAQGGSFRFLREHVEISRSFIIDDGEHPGFSHYQRNKVDIWGIEGEFIGDSHSVECRQWLESCEAEFDLVLIDGDHSYEGVKADWELVEPFLEPDAIIWFHDIHGPEGLAEGVNLFWQELIKSPHISVLMETPPPPTGLPLGIGVVKWRV